MLKKYGFIALTALATIAIVHRVPQVKKIVTGEV